MKKLTLISIMCRGKGINAFCYLPVINGKAVLTANAINDLFYQYWGFIPEAGETICY